MEILDDGSWHWFSLIHPDDVTSVFCMWTTCKESAHGNSIVCRLRDGRDQYRTFRLTIVPPSGDASSAAEYCWLAIPFDRDMAGNGLGSDEDPPSHAKPDAAETGRRIDYAALVAAESGVFEMIAAGLPALDVLEKLNRLVELFCPQVYCSILEISLSRKFFRVGAAPSLPSSFASLFNGSTLRSELGPPALAALERKRVNVPAFDEDPSWAGTPFAALMREHNLSACRALPLLSPYGNISGVLTLYQHRYAELTVDENMVVDRVAKMAAITIDWTRHEEALVERETELRQTHAQLLAGQQISSTGSFTSDIQRDDHRWSDQFYRIFDIDLATKPSIQAVRDRIHPDDITLFDWEMERGLAGNGADFGFRVVATNGMVKFIRGRARVMGHIEGRPIFMGTVQDITDIKLAEATLRSQDIELSRAREQLSHVSRALTASILTASIAHEVSQPLSGILANANACLRFLAADPPDIDGANETVRRTIRDTSRATEIIKRLRAMFNRKQPVMEKTDLNDVAREVVALLRNDINRGLVDLRMELDPLTPAVAGDRIQLQQVISNMLLNATEAMADIQDRERILIVRTEPDGAGNARLSVHDVGIGIEHESAGRLFEAFFTTKSNGMGIGLSISRSIITNHGGEIWAERNSGPGTTVLFSIPGINGVGTAREAEASPPMLLSVAASTPFRS